MLGLALVALGRVAVAADRTRRQGLREARDGAAARRHHRQLLADDDRRRDAETGARGRLSDLVLAIVVVADLVLLVLFSLAMQFARVMFGAGGGDVNVLVRLAWEIGGAVAFGVLVGALLRAVPALRRPGSHPRAASRVCALLSQVGTTQRFEPLLAAMAAGLVIENLAVAQGDALKTAVQRGALPVLVVFFVAVGTSLRLERSPPSAPSPWHWSPLVSR